MRDSTQPSTRKPTYSLTRAWDSMLVRLSWCPLQQRCNALVATPVLRTHAVVAAFALASCTLYAATLQGEVVLPAGIGEKPQEAERERTADATSVVRDESNSTVVSVLLGDGRWALGRLQSVREDSWSILTRDARSRSGTSPQPRSSHLSSVVRGCALRSVPTLSFGNRVKALSCASHHSLSV